MGLQEDQRQKELKRYQKLESSWREATPSMDTPSLRKMIMDCSINNVQVKIAQSMDPDLAALKEQVKIANEPYKEGIDTNNLKIAFIVDVLRGRGEDVPDWRVFVRKGADADNR